MVLHTPKVLVGIHFILLLSPVYASVHFQTLRVDCEPLCRKIQPFTGYCPVYGSCQWYCHEKQAECPTNTRYHCARNFNDQDSFVAACAQETFCRAAAVPSWSLGSDVTTAGPKETRIGIQSTLPRV
ncbi:hypothetical protein DPMN_066185 [Dreissena polymorpha]|uniref:Uncharacterized protein n=1 Tax=Dreissena polymorpha TaxID=45954 RepID=A0A9D3YXC7_DREPO|nr:hypothetical protein DPMN_066185 [Dreissena polymorpha]